MKFRPGTYMDRVYGAILGALLGSAYGVTLDKLDRPLSEEEVQ